MDEIALHEKQYCMQFRPPLPHGRWSWETALIRQHKGMFSCYTLPKEDQTAKSCCLPTVVQPFGVISEILMPKRAYLQSIYQQPQGWGSGRGKGLCVCVCGGEGSQSTPLSVCVCVCVRACMHVCVHLCVSRVCACMYMFMYLYVLSVSAWTNMSARNKGLYGHTPRIASSKLSMQSNTLQAMELLPRTLAFQKVL